MKRNIRYARVLYRSFLAALLVISMLTAVSLSTFAGENEKTAFLSAVGELDSALNYAQRSANVDAAVSAYGKLTETERKDDDVVSAKVLLDAEASDVSALAEDAQVFLAAISAVADAANIMAKIDKIEEAGELLFEDESYPGITEAKTDYYALKESLDAIETNCIAFIEAVETAKRDFDDEAGYRTVKASLDLATPLLDTVDSEYDRVENMKDVYKGILASLLEIERDNDAFLRQVSAMESSSTYRDLLKYLGFCEQTFKNVEDEDYDGIAEGKTAMENTRVLLAEKTVQATVFSEAVYGVIHAADYAERVAALANAESERAKTDLTVPQAEIADTELTNFKDTYQKTVEYENAAMDAFLLTVFATGRS